MWTFVYKNLENQRFVSHSHSTTLTVIRLVVPGTLIGTHVVSTTRSPAFTKPASGTCAHWQTACPIPRSIMVAAGRGEMGRIRERQGGGFGERCAPPPLGQQFLRTMGLQAGARSGSAS